MVCQSLAALATRRDAAAHINNDRPVGKADGGKVTELGGDDPQQLVPRLTAEVQLCQPAGSAEAIETSAW